MTAEQEAREAARANYHKDREHKINLPMLDIAFDYGWDAAIEYSDQWTYCEDAFPTKPDEYLITYISIYDGKPASGVAEYVRDEWRYDDGDVFTVPVIAWRPLPEPAEIKRSEDEV